MAQIHELIGQAMREIGAIGKNSKNQTQGFMYRGIDAVYNALNPVMAKLGIFICPEIEEMNREERRSVKKDQYGNERESVLMYSVLRIRYTVYAPDGSNISLSVVGEAMDSGDKSINKAMSVGMKYAMFQLFCIPTEEMKDPDADVYTDIQPKKVRPEAGQKPAVKPGPKPVPQQAPAPDQPRQINNIVDVSDILPPVAKPQPPQPSKANPTPVQTYLLKAMKELREARGITASQNNKLFREQKDALVAAGLAPDKKLEDYTLPEAEALIDAMYKTFSPEGTEVKK